MPPLVLPALFTITADVKDSTLRADLLARVKTDQAARTMRIDAVNPPAELLTAVKKADDRSRAWLKGVIEKHGRPGQALVGEDGAHAA